MQATCPHCQLLMEAPGGVAGQTVGCPGCSRPFRLAEELVSVQTSSSSVDAWKRRASSSGIFDVGFRSFISPTLISVIYVISLIGVTLWLVVSLGIVGYGLIMARGLEARGAFAIVLYSLGNILGAAFFVLLLRVSCESALVLFRIEEHLRRR